MRGSDAQRPRPAAGDPPEAGGAADTAAPGAVPDVGRSPTVLAPGGAPAEEDLPAGLAVGEFRVERRAGAGAMGTIYAAIHPLIGKQAAIKVINRELCRDPDAVQRFFQEARAVNRIHHPDIVDIFSFGHLPDGRSYFIMEWLDGEDLAARLAHPPPLSLGEAAELLERVARALEAAHGKGVVHRDLKPANVFVVHVEGRPRPHVKLLDFGIAKLVGTPEEPLQRTPTGALVGTPLYLSPEQVRGEPATPACDAYSFGVMAFQVLTGRPPFVSLAVGEILAKHLMEEAPAARAFWPGLPPALDRLLAGLLEKSSVDRRTLAEAAAVLAEHRDSAAVLPPARSLEDAVLGERRSRPTTGARVAVAGSGAVAAATLPAAASAASAAAAPARSPRRVRATLLGVATLALLGIGIALVAPDLAGRGRGRGRAPAGSAVPAAIPGDAAAPVVTPLAAGPGELLAPGGPDPDGGAAPAGAARAGGAPGLGRNAADGPDVVGPAGGRPAASGDRTTTRGGPSPDAAAAPAAPSSPGDPSAGVRPSASPDAARLPAGPHEDGILDPFHR